MRILPTPKPVTDRRGKQWAAYSLKDAKKLIKLDSELVELRGANQRLAYLKEQYKQKCDLLEKLLSMKRGKYEILEQRFIEKAASLERCTEEKMKYKYRRSFSGLFGKPLSIGFLLAIAAGVVAVK